jgi:hypothetical protein
VAVEVVEDVEVPYIPSLSGDEGKGKIDGGRRNRETFHILHDLHIQVLKFARRGDSRS